VLRFWLVDVLYEDRFPAGERGRQPPAVETPPPLKATWRRGVVVVAGGAQPLDQPLDLRRERAPQLPVRRTVSRRRRDDV
jgi:hypothetical protein